jgi:acetyl-CoA C-acetyltransferase
MTRSVIIAGARTPIGRFRGSLAGFDAVDLGRSPSARRSIARVVARPGRVRDHGACDPGGHRAITPVRRPSGGHPQEVPAITVNKVCLSGLSAIAMADQMIRAGELEIVVAGGWSL